MDKREDGGVDREGAEQVCASPFEQGGLAVEEPALIYDPTVRKRPGKRLEFWGDRENRRLVAWGFWGGVAAAAAVVGLILAFSSPARVPLSELLPLMGVLFAGAIAYRLGRRSNLEQRLLLEVDGTHQVVSWPTRGEKTLVALAFADVEAVTFETIRFAVPGSRANTHIDAVAVSVVDEQGRKLPVIEASTTKSEAHQVARILAQVLGQELDYVGTGTGEWA